jgi:hypothetical protein
MNDIRFDSIGIAGYIATYNKETVLLNGRFWEVTVESTILHETIHRTLEKLFGFHESSQFDNIWGAIMQTDMLVNPEKIQWAKWWKPRLLEEPAK